VLGIRRYDETKAGIRRSCGNSGGGFGSGRVDEVEAEHLVRLAKDPALTAVYQRALLRVMDSRVVLGAATLLGLAKPSLVPGSDLTAELLTKHLQPGDRVTVIGLWPRDLPLLRRRFPSNPIAHHFPPPGFERDEEAFQTAIAFVEANPARYYVFACGMPRQELLGDRLLARGRLCGTALCVGSALEFLIGAQQRAPVRMQKAGLEWLFRLYREPRRLAKRYLVQSPPIFALLIKERLRRRGR
jgi:N-acetylglucosaminyldiphosphoundecaprenol N-acetyl-beta-D-mannosaminyltransferase